MHAHCYNCSILPLPFAVPEVSLEYASYVVAENAGALEVCVILTTPVGTVVDIAVILTSGSAREGTISYSIYSLVRGVSFHLGDSLFKPDVPKPL